MSHADRDYQEAKEAAERHHLEQATGIKFPKPAPPPCPAIHLVDLNPSVITAFKVYASRSKILEPMGGTVTAMVGDLCKSDAHAIVSPANSFGFMDGGLDLALAHVFQCFDLVRHAVELSPGGEIAVGHALAVPVALTIEMSRGQRGDIDARSHSRYLIVAPTMRVPCTSLRGTVNPYLATKAAILSVQRVGLRDMAIPGMGTGAGGMSPGTAAVQMVRAMEDALQPRKPVRSWQDAYAYQYALQDGSWELSERERS